MAFAWGSRSTRRVGRSATASALARLTAVVVFPTPPFWFTTAMQRPGARLVPRGTPASSSVWGIIRNWRRQGNSPGAASVISRRVPPPGAGRRAQRDHQRALGREKGRGEGPRRLARRPRPASSRSGTGQPARPTPAPRRAPRGRVTPPRRRAAERRAGESSSAAARPRSGRPPTSGRASFRIRPGHARAGPDVEQGRGRLGKRGKQHEGLDDEVPDPRGAVPVGGQAADALPALELLEVGLDLGRKGSAAA